MLLNLLKKNLNLFGKSVVASNAFIHHFRRAVSFTLVFIRLPWYSLLLNDLPINPFCMSKLVLTPQFFPSLGSSNFKFSSFKLDKAEGTVRQLLKQEIRLLNHKRIRGKRPPSAGSPW